MRNTDFALLDRAIVFSDLHLNMLWGSFETRQQTRLRGAIEKEGPETIILNGDTIDLFFGIKNGRRGADIETVLEENTAFVRLIRSVPNLFILVGAHDQALRWNTRFCRVLRDCFPNCK